MLRVTIELVPHGEENRAKIIGEMLIANDGTGSHEHGNYQAVVNADLWSGEPIKYMYLGNWSRVNDVWSLIEKLLSVRKNDEIPKEGLYNRLIKRFKNETK